MAYTTYRLLFADSLRRGCKMDIIDTENLGTDIYTLKGNENSPVSVGFEGDSGNNVNKYDPIKALHCKISLVSNIRFQYYHFYSSNPKRFRVEVSVMLDYANYTPMFIGYIEPDVYQEPYTQPPYEVSFSAVDGLVRLKDTDFPIVSGTGILATDSDLNIILFILNKIGSSLNVETCCNIKEADMAAGNVFTLAYNKLAGFIKSGKPMSCYEVLEQILTVYQCRIIQHKGKWVIVRVDEMFTGIFTFYEYTYQGTYVGLDTVDLNKTFTSSLEPKETFMRFAYENNMLMIIPPWKKFYIQQDYVVNPCLVPNYDFKGFAVDDDGYKIPTNWTLTKHLETDYLRIIEGDVEIAKYGDHCAILYGNQAQMTSDGIDIPVNNVSLSIIVNGQVPLAITDSVIMEISLSGASTYYLYKDGDDYKWSLSSHTIAVPYPPIIDEAYGITERLNIITDYLPISGTILIHFYSLGSAYTFFRIDSIFLKANRLKSSIIKENREIETLIEDKNNYIPSDLELQIGDIPDIDNSKIIYNGGILLSDGTPTKEWLDPLTEFNGELLLSLAWNAANQYRTPSQMIQGTVRGVANFMTIMQDTLNLMRKFVWSHQVEWNIKKAEISGCMFELKEPLLFEGDPTGIYLGDNLGNVLVTELDEYLSI